MKKDENKTEQVKADEKKKKQKVSASYTIQSYAGNVGKLEDLKLIEKDEVDVLNGIKEKIVQRYVASKFK